MKWRLGRHELLAIVGFWTLFAALTTANRLLDGFGPTRGAAALSEAIFWVAHSYLWAVVTPLVFWLAWRFEIRRSNWLSRCLFFLGLGVLGVVVMTLLREVLWRSLVDFPRPRGGAAPRSLLGVLLRPWFLNDLVTFAGVFAAGLAREYFVRYRARQEEAVRLEAHAAQLQAQLADARLEALRMQLNPHFLFNTLHAISTLVERDPRGVRRMIARLSELLRYTLNGAGEPEVPVEQEFDLVRRYLEIMQVRFQGRLEITTGIEPEASGALVPTLILQPLVENAVKHGVSNLVETTGRIDIRAERSGEWLVLRVRDNGPGPHADGAPPESGGVGLRNVRARLAELYGEDHGLTLLPAEGGGAVAEIRLPFLTGADLRVTDASVAPAHAAG
ncbi:MAG: histidine kinase [Gemmatimonadota bacterium]|nr:histidine kinase [Gemmatimonadota bacterium]